MTGMHDPHPNPVAYELLIALGLDETTADAVWLHLAGQVMPDTRSQCRAQIAQAIRDHEERA